MRGSTLLALDTSSAIGSVAVAREGEILARTFVTDRKAQAALLVPAIAEALEESGVDRTELSGIVVGRGPGSFTGIRIAAATARGLAMGLEVPVWGWSSLAAAAFLPGIPESVPIPPGQAGPVPPEEAAAWPRYVLFDARADRVYAGCYLLETGTLEELRPPSALTIGDLLRLGVPSGVRFCGDGALAHAELLEEAGFRVLPFPAGLPTAEGLLRVHELHPGAAPLGPSSRWEPDYLRASSAQREARAGVPVAGEEADAPGREG